MESLDSGLVRAIALATGANEEEIRRSTAQRSFDRLHASYALLVDKIARFVANPRLREIVEMWIRESASAMPTSKLEVAETGKSVAEETTVKKKPATAKLTSWREVEEEEEDESHDLEDHSTSFEVTFPD